MCCGNTNKEMKDLLLDVPTITQEKFNKLLEFVSIFDSKNASTDYIFNTFNQIYGTNYVNNIKQQRRSLYNMTNLVNLYKRNELKIKQVDESTTLIFSGQEYTYDSINDVWVYSDKEILKKGYKKIYSNAEYLERLQKLQQKEMSLNE